ncbi:hypothetical protein [Hyphomonas oceanitis]|uniref:hypothetical protein n=1 Tax=Hyphomonas oceanitis TaxID=81033 RepID=UPI003003178E
MFNSLLILMPVIAAQILGAAFSGATFSDAPTVEAIDQTRRNMDESFAAMAPRNADDKYKFWHDIVSRELTARDVTAARGFLLTAPQMLSREEVKELMAAADAEVTGTEDERIALAALRKLPVEVSQRFAEASGAARNMSTLTEPVGDTITETPAEEPEPAPAATEDAPAEEAPSPVAEARFAMLGTHADLANHSERWLQGDRVDELVLKITGIGLAESSAQDATAEANIRALSILKSARRSRRMTPEFTDYITDRLDAALPDSALKPALEEAFTDLATTKVRVERVRAAYAGAINPKGLARLESDLAQINRIGTLTDPAAAVTLIEQVRDGADLRRVRLIAEAGGDRSVALVKQMGPSAMRIADTGVRWTRELVLQFMGLTAAGLVLFWVTLSTLRRTLLRRRPRLEAPQ